MSIAIRLLLLLVTALLTTSCALLGIKSTPWPTSVEIHNREAIAFYRSTPRAIFRSVGVAEIVLIDFFSVSGFSRDQVALLEDLRELADFASNNVTCFRDGREVRSRRKIITPHNLQTVEQSLRLLEEKGGDCLATNFYRVGTLAKTTYLADPFYFRLLWQLGQLSVRMNEARVRSAAF